MSQDSIDLTRKYFITVLCFLFFVSIFAQEKKGPVAKYSFNDGRDFDEVTKRKAKLVGVNFTEDRFGNAGSAVYFFGNEFSYVNLGADSVLKPRSGSISLWTKIELEVFAGKGTVTNPILLTKNSDRDDFYEAYSLYYFPETKRIASGVSGDSLTQYSIYGMGTFRRLTWYHLAITYDDRYFCFYINGKLEGRTIKNYKAIFNPLDSVVLGVSANKKNNRFTNGVVDDIEFYNRVLSEEEILDLYNAPNPNRFRVLLGWIMVALGFVLLILLIYFFVRYRLSLTLKKEQQRLELVNLKLETELRVNRALMNPHFVFNSLNTLQNFILKNENERAYDYLVKFAKLMRRILENNMSDVITLEFEIEMLKRYLEIEDLRFEEDIQHEVVVDPSLTLSSVKIPIMMIQPFVENAIWHGLLKKNGTKTIHIRFAAAGEAYIACTIEDNGLGRKKDIAPGERQSLATSFIEQRLNLLNRIHKLNCTLNIIDKPNETGTIVEITLPILKK